MNKEITQFLHAVKISFPFFQKSEKRFFSDFCNSVNDYADNNPECTKEDLENHFGKPKDIMITYYSNMDADVYFTLMKRTHYIKRIFISVIFVLAVSLIITVSFLVSAKGKYDNATIDHSDTTITETIIE